MKETEGLIKQGMESTPDQAYGSIAQGTKDSAGLLSGPETFNQGLSFGDQALSSAIRSKYSKPYNVKMQGLENKMRLDARNAHQAKLETAHQLASEEAQMNFQKEMIKYKKKMAKRQMRQQLVGSVLGIGATVAGGAMGGPAGAAGGSAVGQVGTQAMSQE